MLTNVFRYLISSLFGLYSLVCILGIVFMIPDDKGWETGATPFFSTILFYVLVVCSSLSYGILKSRRWVYALHISVIGVWFYFWVLMMIIFSQAPEGNSLPSLFVICAPIFGIPILVQWFIEKNNKQFADLDKQIPIIIKFGIVIFSIVPVPFLTSLAGATALAMAMSI